MRDLASLSLGDPVIKVPARIIWNHLINGLHHSHWARLRSPGGLLASPPGSVALSPLGRILETAAQGGTPMTTLTHHDPLCFAQARTTNRAPSPNLIVPSLLKG